MTMISRVLGFLRDIFLTALLGASPVMDAFLIAFRFPNIFRSLFAEGAFSAAFVPLFVRLKKHDTAANPRAMRFAASVGVKLLCLLLVFTLLVVLFMPNIMFIIAPGFRAQGAQGGVGGDSLAMAIHFGRICFPYLLAMAISSLLAGVLQSHGLFWRGSFAASFLNICLIAAALSLLLGVFGPFPNLQPVVIGQVLSWAVVLSGLWQVLYMWVGLKKIYPDYMRPQQWQVTFQQQRHQLSHGYFPQTEKRLLRTMGPAMVGAGGQQLNSLVSDMIATMVGVGAVTHLFYADRLVQLPLGVIGIALSIVLLQQFSAVRHGKKGEAKVVMIARLQPLLQQGLVVGLMAALPAALALRLLGIDIISFLFERGAFDHMASMKTAAALSFFALALPFYIINKVFLPYFYAQHDTKTPVKVTLLAFVLNGSLAFYFSQRLQMGEGGIALASLLAALFNSGIFFILLVRQGALPLRFSFWRPLVLLLLLNLPLAVFYYLLPHYLSRPSWLVLAAVAGSVVYYLPCLWFCRGPLLGKINFRKTAPKAKASSTS